MESFIEITTDKYAREGLPKGTQALAYLSLNDGNNSNYHWVAFLTYKSVQFMLNEYEDFSVVYSGS